MTLAGLRTLVRDYLIMDTTKLPDATVDVFIGTALDEMINAHDWTLPQDTTQSFTYGATTDGVTLPTGFISDQAVYQIDATAAPDSRRSFITRLDGGRPAWVGFTSQSTELEPTQFPRPSVDTTYYFLWGTKLYIIPNPSSTLSYEMDYLDDSSTLADANPFVVKYPRTLLVGAVREAYLWNHEEERAAVWSERFKVMVDAAKRRDTGSRMSGAGKRSR